jgi:DNA-directed RNA polymerase specialized sigma24 family protein
VLDAPLNTVKSRLYYGLKALRKILEQWEIDEEIIGHEL